MGAVLALTSAVVYGVVDYAGGILSRRLHFAFVAAVGQSGGLVLAVVLAIAVPSERVAVADLAWGAASGVGSAVTMLFLNRALSHGPMSTVLPLSAVTGVALSVLCGVWFLAEQPPAVAWIGIVLMLPALWLVSGGGSGRATMSPASRDGLVASLGVAAQYVCLGLASPESGLWAVAAGRVAAVIVLLPVAWANRRHIHVSIEGVAKAALIGAGAALGLALYLLATRQQLLAVAVTLASLYPAIPVLLGLLLLRERITRLQFAGLLAAALSVVLLSIP